MNGITVDNRLENLTLEPDRPPRDDQELDQELEEQEMMEQEEEEDPANSIYWRAMQQLPIDANTEVRMRGYKGGVGMVVVLGVAKLFR